MTICECEVIADWAAVIRTVTRNDKLLPIVIDDNVIHLSSIKVSPI